MGSKLHRELPLSTVSFPGSVVRALLHRAAASRFLPRDGLEGRRACARQIWLRDASGTTTDLGLGQVGCQRDLAEAGLAQSRHVLRDFTREGERWVVW